ncbi:MAG TPA: RluA family pseudouridine synthase [Planctomycetota bacterium]|jgi:23S rRNA pseudouridine955/2504/2580 synthase
MPSEANHPPRLALAQARKEHEGWRADRALCDLVKGINRRAAKTLFHKRVIRLNGKMATGSERVRVGDEFEFPDPASKTGQILLNDAAATRLSTPHGRQLPRLYEDDTLLVISKPSEIPVHRGQGGFTRRDTIEDVLGRAYPPPPGAAYDEQGFYLVHRLDMETSGCMLVAKNAAARDALIRDFSERKIQKQYLAIVTGEVAWQSLIVRRPIIYLKAGDDERGVKTGKSGQPWHKRGRPKPVLLGQKKGVVLEEGDLKGKAAETQFKVLERFKGYTLIHASPKTGRTHQIRVHALSTGHPLAYDPLYGRRTPLRFREFELRSMDSDAGEDVILNRLPLHAWKLSFRHPATGEEMSFEAKLPRDLREFLRLLRKYRKK